MRTFHLRHFLADRLRAIIDLATLPLAFAAHLACDVGEAFDRRARVRGVDGRECDQYTGTKYHCPDDVTDGNGEGECDVPEPRAAWPVAPGVLQGPIAVGDTFAHEDRPWVAWEVTGANNGLYRIVYGSSHLFMGAAELLDPAGPWKRCEARAVQRVRGKCEHPHADRYESGGREFCGAEGCGKRLEEIGGES